MGEQDEDWILLQDFDDVERDHSQPRYEMDIIDAGQTVVIRETAPMSGTKSLKELPAHIVREAADRLDQYESV